MRKVILYVADSLDGYIARKYGDVDWLMDGEDGYGYNDFYDSIDTVLMGNRTYQQVLSFGGDYPYPDKQNYVFTTRQDLTADEHVTFVNKAIPDFVNQLKREEGKDIWLIGGAAVFNLLLREGLVDELMLFTMPLVLGEGIPLFRAPNPERKLKLVDSKAYSNGVIYRHYQVLPAPADQEPPL